MFPLVALRYKETPYGGGTPWEEAQPGGTTYTQTLNRSSVFRTWLSILGDLVPTEKGQNIEQKRPFQVLVKFHGYI